MQMKESKRGDVYRVLNRRSLNDKGQWPRIHIPELGAVIVPDVDTGKR